MTVLTRAQRDFLSKFFTTETGRAFYLTGGGALAEFYLNHRLSQDMDIFTQDRTAWQRVEVDLTAAAEAIGATLDFRAAKPPNEMHRAFLNISGAPELKIDVVRDSPPYFGKPQTQPDGIVVDSLDNITVGKLAALCGRGYPRDFVDVYFLLQGDTDLRKLVSLLKEKDPGIYEDYVAEMMRRVLRLDRDDLPKMLKPLDFDQMKQFFLKLADELVHDKD